CNPRGLLLSHDKPLAKKILTFHRIHTPGFYVLPKGKKPRRPAGYKFPLLVKSVSEDASLGITQSSIVHDDEKLFDRIEYIHQETQTDALIEAYIEGRELYVGVMGNRRLTTLPVWEMVFKNAPPGMPQIATARVKWDIEYQKKLGIDTLAATGIDSSTEQRILKTCKRVYRALSLSGYARMDLRLSDEGKVYVLEANPNPNLSFGEDFAESADKVGMRYESLLQKILTLGLNYLAKVVDAHHKIWGTIPYKQYHFLNVIGNGGGGLEHDNSCLVMTGRWTYRDKSRYKRWLSLASHEFFHTWNVRRLRPK
ncbi:unnamed protein product, partial [marine sediment metagenome]